MSGEAKFTPGPWIPIRASQDYDGALYCEPEDEQERAEMLARPFTGISAPRIGEAIVTAHDLFEFRNPHDAHLIAASPELYSALEALTALAEKKIYPQPDKPNSDWQKVKNAQEALRKARGESQ